MKRRRIDVDVALAMAAAGDKIVAIAAHFGVAEASVRHFLRRHRDPAFRRAEIERVNAYRRAARAGRPPKLCASAGCGAELPNRLRRWCDACHDKIRDNRSARADRQRYESHVLAVTGSMPRMYACAFCGDRGHGAPRCPKKHQETNDDPAARDPKP